LRELIATRAPVRVIKEAAHARGTRLLRASAQDMVRKGLTSQAEIDRITFAGSDMPDQGKLAVPSGAG